MQTKVVKIDPFQIDENEMKEAAELIRKGELVAFPTETVYGLGADALHPEASKKIYAAKGRPSDNPLIVHICKFEELVSIAKEVPAQAEKLADAFWQDRSRASSGRMKKYHMRRPAVWRP